MGNERVGEARKVCRKNLEYEWVNTEKRPTRCNRVNSEGSTDGLEDECGGSADTLECVRSEWKKVQTDAISCLGLTVACESGTPLSLIHI